MVFWRQIASAVTGVIAAALWFRSAAEKAPPMTYDGGALYRAFDSVGRLNR